MKIKVNPLFFVSTFLCCVFGSPLYFLVTYVTLVVHELVHLFFLYREKISVSEIQIEPFGICIKTEVCGKISPFVYFSAPLFNISLAILFYYIEKKSGNGVYLILSVANFIIGAFNLIPVLPFDGGRAIMVFVKDKRRFILLSLTAGIIILAFGIYLFQKTGFNFSLIMIGVFIIANTLSEREQLFHTSAVKAKEKISGKITEMTATRMITVPYDYGAHSLIKSFESDAFYLVNIIKDGVILKTLSETQILEGIINGKTIMKDFV